MREIAGLTASGFTHHDESWPSVLGLWMNHAATKPNTAMKFKFVFMSIYGTNNNSGLHLSTFHTWLIIGWLATIFLHDNFLTNFFPIRLVLAICLWPNTWTEKGLAPCLSPNYIRTYYVGHHRVEVPENSYFF